MQVQQDTPEGFAAVAMPRNGACAVALRELRASLLQRMEIASAVRLLSRQVSARDFYVTFGFLLGGLAGQAYAFASGAWWLSPFMLLIQLFGFAALTSLAHESWHGRSHPQRRVDRWFSRWIYSGLLLFDSDLQTRDHQAHHRSPGEPDDPTGLVWTIPLPRFRLFLLSSALIIPAVVMKIRFLLTGKRLDQNFTDDQRRASPRLWFSILVMQAPMALLMLWISPLALLMGYLLPNSLAFVMTRIREYREHAQLPDGTTAVYDVLCSDFERLLIPGGYFNYHVVHHLFPEIPQRKLPELYRLIARTVDMRGGYYGRTPMIARKQSYLQPAADPL